MEQVGPPVALVVGQAVLALDGAADLGPVHDAGRPDTRAARRAKHPGQKIGTEDDAALQAPLLLEQEAADAVLLGDLRVGAEGAPAGVAAEALVPRAAVRQHAREAHGERPLGRERADRHLGARHARTPLDLDDLALDGHLCTFEGRAAGTRDEQRPAAGAARASEQNLRQAAVAQNDLSEHRLPPPQNDLVVSSYPSPISCPEPTPSDRRRLRVYALFHRLRVRRRERTTHRPSTDGPLHAGQVREDGGSGRARVTCRA